MCCCCAPTHKYQNVATRLSYDEKSSRGEVATVLAIFCISCALIVLAVLAFREFKKLEIGMGNGMHWNNPYYVLSLMGAYGVLGVVVSVGTCCKEGFSLRSNRAF